MLEEIEPGEARKHACERLAPKLSMKAATLGDLQHVEAARRQVRGGERGTEVVLWKPIERHEIADDGHEATRRSLFARAFTVFAAEQEEPETLSA